MNKSFIPSVTFDAALVATFAGFVGTRSNQFATDAVRAACKLAQVKPSQVPKSELVAMALSAAAFLTGKGSPPCAKDGTPYAGKRLTQWAHDVAKRMIPAAKAPKQPGNPLIDPLEPHDPVTVSKKGANDSGAVVYHDSVVVPEMRELASKLISNKSAEVKRLAELVRQFFAA